MKAHVENARIVAEWLDADPRIEFVNWAGLPAHPHHERAKKYLPEGPGSVFSFGVKASQTQGAREAGQRFIESFAAFGMKLTAALCVKPPKSMPALN